MPCAMVKLTDIPEMNYYAKNGEGEVSGVTLKGYALQLQLHPRTQTEREREKAEKGSYL